MIKIGKLSSLVALSCCGGIFAPNSAYAQQTALPDEPGYALVAERSNAEPFSANGARGDSQQTVPSRITTLPSEAQREPTWRTLPGDFLHDQKDLWTFPIKVAKGHYLLPTLLVIGGTAGLIFADPHAMPYFQKHEKNLDDVNDVFDPMITTGEVIALPAGLLAAGYLRHDQREVSTALLAAEAYGDSVVVNLAIKAVTRRERPADVPLNGSFEGTFFNGGKSPLKGSSFPSGHSTAVWSVATVVAERYRHRGKPWIPVLSYALATAISCSRITSMAHFPSDVFLGASLGYTIAKYQTLSPR